MGLFSRKKDKNDKKMETSEENIKSVNDEKAGENTKLIDDEKPKKERFKTLKNIGRGMVGRDKRISQDIYMLDNIGKIFNSISLGEFFKCEIPNNKIDVFKTYKLCCSKIVGDFLNQVDFKRLWDEAKKKYKTMRIHESSISLWWDAVWKEAQKEDAKISNEIKNVSTEDYTLFKSKIKSLKSEFAGLLDFIKIGKDSKRFFSSLNSSNTELAVSANKFNSVVDECNKKILESLDKAISAMSKIVDYFEKNVDSEKKRLSTDLETFKKRFSSIPENDISLVKGCPGGEKIFKKIQGNLKSAEICVKGIGLDSHGVFFCLRNASAFIDHDLRNDFGEIDKMIREEKQRKYNRTVSDFIEPIRTLSKEAELFAKMSGCENKDLIEIRKNVALAEKTLNDKDIMANISKHSEFFEETRGKIRESVARFKTYCVLCRKLPDYISKFKQNFLDDIIIISQGKDDSYSLTFNGKKWLSLDSTTKFMPNFHDVVCLSENGLSYGVDNEASYRFYDGFKVKIQGIFLGIEELTMPFQKLDKSNYDKALEAINKFLNKYKGRNLLKTEEINKGSMKRYFDDETRDWNLVTQKWNDLMELLNEKIMSQLVKTKSRIESLRDEGYLSENFATKQLSPKLPPRNSADKKENKKYVRELPPLPNKKKQI